MSEKNLKEMNIVDLEKLLVEKRRRLVNLRFDLAAGKVKNVKEIREIKKEIARILTFINMKKKINK